MNRMNWRAGLRLTAVASLLALSSSVTSAQTSGPSGTPNACGDVAGTPATSNFGGVLSVFNIERRVPITGFSSVDTLAFPAATLQSVQGGALEFRERLFFNPQTGLLTSTLFTQQPSATFPTPLGLNVGADTLQTFAIQVDRIYTGRTPHASVLLTGRVVSNTPQAAPFGNLNCAPAAVSVSFPRSTTGGGTTGGGTTGGGTTGGGTTGGTTDTSIANVVVLIAGQVSTFSTTASGTVTVSNPAVPPDGGGNGGGGTGPTANAGPAKQQAVTQLYALSGLASTPGTAGGALTYQWRIPAGAKSASLTNPTSATPQIFFGQGFGDYEVELVVTDANGVSSAPARITISYSGP